MNDKLKHFIIKNYLNKEYSGLVRYETDGWKDYIFFMKDGKVIYEYNKKNGVVYPSYDKIWSFLESYFGLEYEEIQSLTKEWVEEQFKLDVTTTDEQEIESFFLVEEQFKLDVTTTCLHNGRDLFRVEEHYKLNVTTTSLINSIIATPVEEQFKLETNDQQTKTFYNQKLSE